jgi:heat shock protein HslJ
LPACGATDTDSLGSTSADDAPVIQQAALSVVAAESDDNVVVSAGAGAVSPGGVEVTVTNETAGESRSTTSALDGSFEVTVPGSVSDVYEVSAGSGDDVSTVVLNGEGSPGPSGDPTALSGLVGNDYLLESSEGFTPVAGTVVRINIDEKDFGFSAGCKGHGGSYTFCDGRLCSSNFGSTAIACEAPRHTQDEWLADFFTSMPSVVRMGDRVTFATEGSVEDASLVFLDSEVANPDRSLTGRVWSIDTLVTATAAWSSTTQMTPTLEFGVDSSVTVFTTCVQGTGSWDSGIGPPPEGELTLGTISYPDEPCDESGSTMMHDHIVSVITQGVVTFTIDETRLTVMRGELGLGARTE